jgi:methionyl-tRNA formyltransferase
MAIISSISSRLSIAINSRNKQRRYFRRYFQRSYHVLFLGTDEVSTITLARLISLRQSLSPVVTRLDVVTPADRPQGRGREMKSVPIMNLAKKHLNGAITNIYQVPYGLRDLSQWTDGITSLQELKPDIGVVVSFGYFLPPNLLNVFSKNFAINMHPSLLPRHRGAAPIPHAILSGDKETGVSIIDVDRNAFDSGAILLQKDGVKIDETITNSTLTRQLSELGADCVEKVLLDLDGYRQKRVLQSTLGATKAPKLKPEFGLISSVTLSSHHEGSSLQLYRKWRAFEDSIGLYCFYGETENPKRLKLIEIAPLPISWSPKAVFSIEPQSIGSIVFDSASKILALLANDGCWIQLVRVQPEFKRIMTGEEFGRGIKSLNMKVL